MAKHSKKADFSRRLEALMLSKKITVREAAKIADVGVSTIQGWKNGVAPTDFEAVKRLARYFETSMSYLLTGEDEGASKTPMVLEDFFSTDGVFFDGICQVTIKRLVPRKDILGVSKTKGGR
jgi:transcriptional regulator with XRE-family HTH domain